MAKILFVDDEESIRTLCAEELEEEGYEVVTTGKCKDVLELIASTQPSAVVLDIRMEDCNGLDLLQEIRNTYQDLPIILNTAYDSYREDVKSIAANHYVVKSFDLAELKAKLAMEVKGKNPS
jgi:DNA-binding response OmpR family regulator